MYKRFIGGVLSFLMFGNLFANEVRIDTIYYDRDWKGASHKAFATYYRVYEINDSKESKSFRDFYITGELQAEGYYITIDKNNDANSVFNGKLIHYYKSGKIEQTMFLNKGVVEGDYTSFYENGLVKQHSPMIKGKMNGIVSQFSEDGSTCKQIEMVDGEPQYDYYILSNKDGLFGKFSISDNTQIWESPDISEKNIFYVDGKPCSYYLKNGILISMTNSQVKDYGKWFQVSLLISNKTMEPFDFNPVKIKAYIVNEKTKGLKNLPVYSAENYIREVKDSQNWGLFWARLGEGIAASNAGYSKSITQSNTTYNANSNVHGDVNVRGTQGKASVNFNGYGTFSGSSNTTSTTVTYDGTAAYQAYIISSNRIADNKRAFLEELKTREEGYLKRTTIYPGETISGYVYITQLDGNIMGVIIDINGAKYTFEWVVKNAVGPLDAISALLPKHLSTNVDKIPKLPCNAEITDKVDTTMNIVVYSIDSDLIQYKIISKDGKEEEKLKSVKTEVIKRLLFQK